MNTLEYVLKKYNVVGDMSFPIRLPGKRDELCKLFKELGYKRGAEIGVDRGFYATQLCLANPELKLYGIDPWEVYKTKVADPFYNDQRKLTRRFVIARRRMRQLNCEIIRKFSMDAVKDFKPNSLDFVYIDGNHDFDHVLEDVIEWSKIVRPGGIVSGHDYGYNKHKEVSYHTTGAISGYVKVNNIDKFFIFSGDRSASWFFIK